jgi:O-antigen/teichoic acid export membrane protein
MQEGFEVLCAGSDFGSPLFIFNREKEYAMKKEEKPPSNRIRIGILIASLIAGVLLALFSILANPH